MASTSWYWTLIQLKSSGGYTRQTIAPARRFFQQLLPNLPCPDNLESKEDRQIQQQFMTLLRDVSAVESTRISAEQCLRCYISHQILYVCIDLVTKFGQDHGFTLQDVLGIVLTDVDLSQPFFNCAPLGSYRPLAAEMIANFNPQFGSLSTWASTLTRQHHDLSDFLLEHGILQQSNWALLNEKTPNDLQRILSDEFNLPAFEVEQACTLLSSYHAVYRRDRRGRRGKCTLPTEQQLLEIQQRSRLSLSPSAVMARLMELADYLRQHRLLSKGILPAVPMDDPDLRPKLEAEATLQHPTPDPEADGMTQGLYELVNQCLDQAIKTAIDQRYTYLQKQTPGKAKQYLLALKRYCCDQKTMAEIAIEIGLEAQYQVTRLLKIDDLLAAIRRQLLQQLKTHLLDLVKTTEMANETPHYLCADRLQNLEEHHLATIIDKPRANSQISNAFNSFFIQRLCRVIHEF